MRMTTPRLMCWLVALAIAPMSQASTKFTTIVGGQAPTIAYYAIYVGQQAGFFGEEGLDVKVQYGSGASHAMQLAAAGQADVAHASIDPAIYGRERGLTGKAIMRTNNRMVYYIAVPDESNIRVPADLKGKKIGVQSMGSAAIPVVRNILRLSGVTIERDTLVPVGINDQALAALSSNQVQALGLFSAVYFGLERTGIKMRYFHHPEFNDFGSGTLFTSEASVKGKRNELCAYGRALAKSTLFALTNPEAAVRMYWTANPSGRRGATEAEALENGVKELKQYLADVEMSFPPSGRYGRFNIPKIEAFTELLKAEGLVTNAPPMADVVDTSFNECMNRFDGDAVAARAAAWKP